MGQSSRIYGTRSLARGALHGVLYQGCGLGWLMTWEWDRINWEFIELSCSGERWPQITTSYWEWIGTRVRKSWRRRTKDWPSNGIQTRTLIITGLKLKPSSSRSPKPMMFSVIPGSVRSTISMAINMPRSITGTLGMFSPSCLVVVARPWRRGWIVVWRSYTRVRKGKSRFPGLSFVNLGI